MADIDVHDWNACSSEGEEDGCEAGQTQGEGKWEIPLKVLLLYSKIEENGFIELKVKECRRDKESAVQPCLVSGEEESHRVSHPAEPTNAEEETNGKDAIPAQNIEKEKTPEPSAFDYTEESTDETSHLTRKIPKTERFQRKRVGTLENVISDLKRFRDMDNKETVDTDNKKEAAPETDAAPNHTPTEL